MKITWECPVMRRVIWTENWIMRVEIQGKRFIYLRTCGDASATQLKIWSWNARKYSSGCLHTFHFLPVSWNVSINSHLRVKSFFLGDFRSSDAKIFGSGSRWLGFPMSRCHGAGEKRLRSWLRNVRVFFTNSLLMSVFIFFFQIFRSFCSWNKEHFIFEHLRKILQPSGGIFLLPYKWCINYANVFCFRVFYWNYLELDPKLYFFLKSPSCTLSNEM